MRVLLAGTTHYTLAMVVYVASVATILSPRAEAGNGDFTQSLAGTWRFALDRTDVGVQAHWFSRELTNRITLPGILQAQGYGDDISVDTPWVAGLPRDMRWYLLPQYQAYTQPGNAKMPYLSQPVKHYLGVAWYQHDITIPVNWQPKRVVLTLERPRWQTTVYLDDQEIGSCTSLVAPHVYDLGTVPPGRHQLSIRIDNRMILPYRPDGHSVSDAEGATWNGIVGEIELTATSPVWIEDVQAFPNVRQKSVHLKAEIGNSTGKPGAGTIIAGMIHVPVAWNVTNGQAGFDVPLGPDAKTWSEFSPSLQHITVRLTGNNADDRRDVTFGLREIKASGKNILLNGTVIGIRATHNGGGFPLTGYPPTDVASWKSLIKTCQSWGLNGMRFHSWCPPDAAFTAADELGFYLLPECGMWNSFDPQGKMLAILNDESARLVKAYGNHPSFIVLGAGNEFSGHYQEQLPSWDRHWRETDSRRLYSDSSGWAAFPDAPGQPFPSDVMFGAGRKRTGPVRGPTGWFGSDYESSLHSFNIPILAHELGQWCAYPDFSVIAKFNGYLRPGNYEIMRDSARAHGLLDDNKELAYASGRFQLACYKEDIEADLRTPSYSGFDLLDLHDYLGQGTALIGLLDAFWQSKGYVTAEEFRHFCGPVVPLARLHDRVYTTTDSLNTDVELANFGPVPLSAVQPVWQIEDAAGKVLTRGKFSARDLPIGKNLSLGHITVALSTFPAPCACKLIVNLRGTSYRNDWNFWVYPAAVDASVPTNVLMTGSWSEAEARLAAGGDVLFQPQAEDLDSSDPTLSTVPIFWNRLTNPGGAWMLGLWCDTNHPALAGFPTAVNCDWQWVDLIRGVHALNLDSLPRALHPIVEPIDDWNRNNKFGLIYECVAGNGRLLVCSLNLNGPQPGTKSLRRSLLNYMSGENFRPSVAVSLADLRQQWVSTRGVPPNGSGPSQVLPPPAPEVEAPGEVPASAKGK
jgi:hypothetical protein